MHVDGVHARVLEGREAYSHQRTCVLLFLPPTFPPVPFTSLNTSTFHPQPPNHPTAHFSSRSPHIPQHLNLPPSTAQPHDCLATYRLAPIASCHSIAAQWIVRSSSTVLSPKATDDVQLPSSMPSSGMMYCHRRTRMGAGEVVQLHGRFFACGAAFACRMFAGRFTASAHVRG
eukprot:353696-Chlamydomonas_euryale.AAC.7